MPRVYPHSGRPVRPAARGGEGFFLRSSGLGSRGRNEGPRLGGAGPRDLSLPTGCHPPMQSADYSSLNWVTSEVTVALASPSTMRVFSLKNSGLSIPA